MSLAFHNGRFIPRSELAVGFHDAGFVFGATVTDFCRTYRHKLFRWPDHLARLRRDCDACFVPLPYSDDELTAAAEQLVEANAKGLAPDDDLAVITFATPGPLGYMVGEPDNGPPTVAMHTFPIPKERYRRFFTEGVVLEMAGFLPGIEVVPAHAKHRSRIHWWIASRENRPNLTPVLVADKDEPDTAIGTVLTVKEGAIDRPADGPVLDSISLRVVMELAEKLGIEVRVRSGWAFGTATDGTTELLLAGSAFGVAGVREFLWLKGQQKYVWPGPVFTKLAAAWSDLVGLDIVKQFTG